MNTQESGSVLVMVVRYADARPIGIVRISTSDWSYYEASVHPSFQWPEGIARASDFLPEKDRSRLEMAHDDVFYLEGTVSS